jgi:hypothetical protein
MENSLHSWQFAAGKSHNCSDLNKFLTPIKADTDCFCLVAGLSHFGG